MTLSKRIRAGGIIMITLVAVGFVFLGNQHSVQADSVPASATGIAEGVFCILDGFPVTHIFDVDGCASGTTTVEPAELTLIKIVNNAGGGTESPSAWTLSALGADMTVSGSTGSAAVTNAVVPAGTYALSESGGPSGYTPGSWSCTGASVVGSLVSLADNADATCTITNTFTAASGGGGTGGGNGTNPLMGGLIIKKVISGGSATPSMFSFAVNSGAAAAFNANGENDMTVPVGAYNVTEVATSTYTPSYSNCLATVVAAGATSTCTITNTYIANSEGGTTGGGVAGGTSSGSSTPVAVATTSDISLTKSVDNTTPNVGATVTYTITASDTGLDANGVIVQDILPSGLTFVSTSSSDVVGSYASSTGLWTIGKLSSTTPVTLHIMATVNADLANGAVITNTASISGGDTSSDSANNTASSTLTVTIPSATANGGGGVTSGGGGNGPIAGSIGGGGGGNGPIVGSSGGSGGGGGIPAGQVLGASTSTLPTACSQYLTSFIGSGKDNDPVQVERLQTFLNSYEGDHLTVNGVYDASTLAATDAFQKAYGADVLTPWGITDSTGFVYLTTRKEVNTIYCHYTENFPLTSAQQAIIDAARIAVQNGTSDVSVSAARIQSASTPSADTSSGSTTNMDVELSSMASTSNGSSTSITNNPFSSIGSFFKNLFGHH